VSNPNPALGADAVTNVPPRCAELYNPRDLPYAFQHLPLKNKVRARRRPPACAGMACCMPKPALTTARAHGPAPKQELAKAWHARLCAA